MSRHDTDEQNLLGHGPQRTLESELPRSGVMINAVLIDHYRHTPSGVRL